MSRRRRDSLRIDRAIGWTIVVVLVVCVAYVGGALASWWKEL